LQWDRKGGVVLGGGLQVTFHHVILKAQGGSDKPDNLLALDGGCHDVFHGIKSE
jgi:hypothetical protein